MTNETKRTNTPKRATRKKAHKAKYRIDVDQARLFFEASGKEYIIDLLPIEDTHVVTLALERLYQLVKDSKDPYTRADWIKSGRPKNIKAPATVRAISEASNRPLGEVLQTWRKLSADERKRLSADPVVIAARKRLETPHNPEPSNLYLDLFG